MAQLRLAFFVCFFLAITAFADSDEGTSLNLSKTKITGYGFWEAGQIVKGMVFGTNPLNHQWLSDFLVGISLTSSPAERLTIVLNPDFKVFYPLPEEQSKPRTIRPQSAVNINEMYASYSFGESSPLNLNLTLGMFNYKYNAESKDFGEYLFRTGTYPLFIVTDFDFPKSRLLGLKASADIINNLHADILVTSEYKYYPLYDFSFSGVVRYTICNVIQPSVGVNFARFGSVNTLKTSPDSNSIKSPWQISTAENAKYYLKNGDSAYYSFKAIKLMGGISIDPKKLWGNSGPFGPEDLKIYGEAALAGFPYDADTASNFSGYNKLMSRIPLMAGINLPMFNLLDVLSAEIQYFDIGMANDFKNVQNNLIPIGIYDPAKSYNGLRWKWALYARKELLNSITFSSQVAYDHLRTIWEDGSSTTEESMVAKGDWYWMFKFGFKF